MVDENQIKTEELELSELPGYMDLMKAAQSNTLTTDKIKAVTRQLRDQVENELSKFEETPQTWLSLLSLFIPFLGMIRKWYQDQKRVYLPARLMNLTLILSVFNGSEQTAKRLEEQMANLRKSTEKYRNERKWMG